MTRNDMGLIMRQVVEHCPLAFLDQPNAYGWSPLHMLANGKTENKNVVVGMVRTLLRAQVDQNITKLMDENRKIREEFDKFKKDMQKQATWRTAKWMRSLMRISTASTGP